jgi:hypothetical protein
MALNADSLSLDALFGYADIDDVTEEDDRVVLVFTIRGDSDGPQQVSGEDIYDCLDQAATIIRRDRTLSEIRRHGLTDEDVDRLADADDSWKRGYAAGAEDAVEALVSASIRAQAEPAMAMAGEPVTLQTETGELDMSGLPQVLERPGALEDLVLGDGLAITLALVHPAKIVLS